MSDLNSNDFIKALQADTKENLKRQLQTANFMVLAIMDELDVSEVKLKQSSLISVSGGLESHYDFDSDSYVVRRVT